MPNHITKHYTSSTAAETALAHYSWLRGLHPDETVVRFPEFHSHHGPALTFEYVPGRTAEPRDLSAVACALGELHRAARERGGLDRAQANSRFITATGVVLAPFAGPRKPRVQALRTRYPDSPLTHAELNRWLDHAAALPVALYKDANPRNVLLNGTDPPALIDYDTVTLAPVGYDLAKLVVATAMTHGALPAGILAEALAAYAEAIGIEPSWQAELPVWAEVHDLLTRPYLHQHGYHYPWPSVRPWPSTAIPLHPGRSAACPCTPN